MHNFTDEQLVISVRTLFGGGTDTTAGTLTWALVNMVEYPEIRRKVQEEIGKVAGSSQYVTLEHKGESNMIVINSQKQVVTRKKAEEIFDRVLIYRRGQSCYATTKVTATTTATTRQR